MSAATGRAMELAVTVKGEIIESNFDDFKLTVEAQIAEINTDLKTDEDFGQAQSDVKSLAEFEKMLDDTEVGVIEQMEQVHKLVTGIAELKATSSSKRKTLNKLVTDQKKVVKAQIKRDALAMVSIAHPDAELRIDGAMKSKRILATLRSSAEGEAKKIESEISEARKIISTYREQGEESILYDEPKLLTMRDAMLSVELERRVERKRQEAEKAKLQAQLDAEKKAAAEKAAKENEEQISKASLDSSEPCPSNESDSLRQDEGVTASQEMAQFLTDVPSVFLAFRDKRLALKHPENQEKALKFAEGINDLWTQFKNSNKSN